MTLKEFANVDNFYRDKTTGKEIEWHEYMGRVIKKLGVENIKPYMPYNIDVLKKDLNEGDMHLNNTNIERWDRAGGFQQIYNARSRTIEYLRISSGLTDLLHHNGITCYSSADTVCILKETARMLCEEVK